MENLTIVKSKQIKSLIEISYDSLDNRIVNTIIRNLKISQILTNSEHTNEQTNSGALIHVNFGEKLSNVSSEFQIANSLFQNIILNNSLFGINGGAILHFRSPIKQLAKLIIKNSTFVDIFCLNGAISLYFSGFFFLIDNCLFLNNKMYKDNYITRGNILCMSALSFINSTRIINTTGEYDCGFHLSKIKDQYYFEKQHLFITNSSFIRCSCLFAGSVIIHDNTIANLQVSFSQVHIENCFVGDGIIKFATKHWVSLNFFNLNMVNNVLRLGGTIVFILKQGVCSFQNFLLEGNKNPYSNFASATGIAGLTEVVENRENLKFKFENMTMINNSGKYWGNFYMIGSTTLVVKSKFLYNIMGQGSAITGVFADLFIENSLFYGNYAERYGAAILLRDSSRLYLKNCSFFLEYCVEWSGHFNCKFFCYNSKVYFQKE